MAKDAPISYCSNCKLYLGSDDLTKCPYCGVIFSGTLPIDALKRDTAEYDPQKFLFFIRFVFWSGVFCLLLGYWLSNTIDAWAGTLSNMGLSLVSQAGFFLLFFFLLYALVRFIFWIELDSWIMTRGMVRTYKVLLFVRKRLAPWIGQPWKIHAILLGVAFLLTFMALLWGFGWDLHGYDIWIGLLMIGLGGWLIFIAHDISKQRQRLERIARWQPPPNLDIYHAMLREQQQAELEQLQTQKAKPKKK